MIKVKEQVSEEDKREHLFSRILMDAGIIFGVLLLGFFLLFGPRLESFLMGILAGLIYFNIDLWRLRRLLK